MRPYAVEVSFTMIVMADGENDAYTVAFDKADDAWRDTYDKDQTVIGLIQDEEDLKRHGWDGMCIPYGGDRGTRLKDILPNLTPDRETIDMFGER